MTETRSDRTKYEMLGERDKRQLSAMYKYKVNIIIIILARDERNEEKWIFFYDRAESFVGQF